MSDNKIEHLIIPNILEDEPAVEDSLGTHRRVAGGLVSLIKTQVGGKVVALGGTWGSGKSTVVNFVRAQLAGDHKFDYRMVIFDTWVHRGDPFRYAFLERLIKSITEKDQDKPAWLTDDEASTGLAEIRTTHQEREVDKTPYLHWPAVLILVSMLSWPLATHLGEIIAAFPNAWHPFIIPFKDDATLFLYVLPLMIIGLVYIFTRPWLNIGDNNNRFWTGVAIWGKTTEKSFISLFVGGVLHWKWASRSKEIEPTSLEFQKLIADLLDRTFTGKKRKLIIVFDNLDRVDSVTANHAWDALQSISELLRTDLMTYKERIWILIPLDEGRTLEFGALMKSDNENSKIQRDYLKKIFNLSFNVPAQLLSKWALYFDEQAAIALKGLSAGRINTLRAIFGAYNRNHSITPRLVEPPRVLRRLQPLREWSHEQVKQVFT